MPTYTLLNTIYLDKLQKCHKKIITIDKMPDGNLKQYVKQLQKNPLSPFENNNCCGSQSRCIYAIIDFDNTNELLMSDQIGKLFSFLRTNNYTIDTELTRMMNESSNKMKNLVCFISI